MAVEVRIPTRMGDGFMVEMTRGELRADLEDATREAARKAKCPPLARDELDHLLDIYASRAAFTAVDIGDQVVLSCDGGGSKMTGTDLLDLLESEQRLGQDILELWHIEYSYKAIKTILPFQQQVMQNVQLMCTAPVQYGAQPNLAFYSKPDGPADNWFELLPRGDIAGARAAIDEAMDHATKDFIYVGEGMLDAGADGMDFDTTGGAGDADFFSTLRAVRHLREKYPDAGIEVGMAGEYVIGVHGELEWDGRRLAGLWPAEQLEVCQDAGATVFGPAVNIRTGRSCAWNACYAITVCKPAMAAARIPVHPNVGEGVGGVPVNGYPPEDAASRAARAHVDILKCDGL
jgi:dimethylamine--corrinoid protein Co-methyltransferase